MFSGPYFTFWKFPLFLLPRLAGRVMQTYTLKWDKFLHESFYVLPLTLQGYNEYILCNKKYDSYSHFNKIKALKTWKIITTSSLPPLVIWNISKTCVAIQFPFTRTSRRIFDYYITNSGLLDLIIPIFNALNWRMRDPDGPWDSFLTPLQLFSRISDAAEQSWYQDWTLRLHWNIMLCLYLESPLLETPTYFLTPFPKTIALWGYSVITVVIIYAWPK